MLHALQEARRKRSIMAGRPETARPELRARAWYCASDGGDCRTAGLRRYLAWEGPL